MKNFKGISLIFSVLIMSLFVSYIVFAWTEPSLSPPDGNVDTPLNTGATAQTKDNSLSITALYDTNDNNYWIDPASPISAILSGSVGIGTTAPTEKLTIAGQFFSEAKFGNVPLQSMAVLGGTERMRGIYENRYRDKTVVMGQMELRFPIFWIVSGTVFGGMGQVAPTYGDLKMNSFHYGYGTGFRVLIDKATDSVLRFDFSFRKGGHSIFIGFNEAF